MLAKILEDMWVEPEVLEALSEEQRRILFLKMREEQVRRWREREELEESEGRETTRPEKASSKHVTWLLGRDGDVSVVVIGQVDEFRSSKLLNTVLNRLQGNGMNGIQTMTLLPERDTHQLNSKQHIQLLLNDEDDMVTPNDRSSSSEEEEELDSGSADEDPKDLAEDSDSESEGSGAGNLKQWPPRYRPHPSSHGNQPPLTARLSGAEGTREPDKVAACRQGEKTSTGRVAQLRRAFASGSSSAFAKPPVPTKPPHLQKLATPLVH